MNMPSPSRSRPDIPLLGSPGWELRFLFGQWAVYDGETRVRYLEEYQAEYVDSALNAARSENPAPISSGKGFDPKCADLALHFVSNAVDLTRVVSGDAAQLVQDLAQHIQVAVEDFLQARDL